MHLQPTKEPKTRTGERTVSPINSSGETGYSESGMELPVYACLLPDTEIHSKRIKDLNEDLKL